MKKVAFVNEGGWRGMSAEKGDYDTWLNMMRRTLERTKTVEVRVFDTNEKAREWLGGIGVIVFVTRGMLCVAQEIKKQHPGLIVVLFTGECPVDHVVILDKAWGSRRGSEILRQIALVP